MPAFLVRSDSADEYIVVCGGGPPGEAVKASSVISHLLSSHGMRSYFSGDPQMRNALARRTASRQKAWTASNRTCNLKGDQPRNGSRTPGNALH